MDGLGAPFDPPPAGHTRWGRAALVAVAALAAAGAVLTAIAQQVLAATLTVGGFPLVVTTDDIDLVSVGIVGDRVVARDGEVFDVATVALDEGATIAGLCASLAVPTGIGGGFTLRVDVAEGRTLAGRDVVLRTATVRGDLQAGDIIIGVDAATFEAGGTRGPQGAVAIAADELRIDDLRTDALRVDAGVLEITGLHVDVLGRDGGC